MKKKESYMIYKRFLKKLRDFKLDNEETKAKISRSSVPKNHCISNIMEIPLNQRLLEDMKR